MYFLTASLFLQIIHMGFAARFNFIITPAKAYVTKRRYCVWYCVPVCRINGQAYPSLLNDQHGTEGFGFSKPRQVSAKMAETWFCRVIAPLSLSNMDKGILRKSQIGMLLEITDLIHNISITTNTLLKC